MVEQNNQVARELKQLDTKEPDPPSLNVRELRGRSVNEELHMPSIRQPPQSQYMCMMQFKIKKKVNGICLPPPINQSTPALVSSMLPQSSSDLDTDQGEFIDETIKEVAQSVNQMLLMSTTGNPTSNLTPSNSSQNKTLDRQSIPTLILSDIHTQTKILILTDKFHLKTALHTQLQISNRLNKS